MIRYYILYGTIDLCLRFNFLSKTSEEILHEIKEAVLLLI
jgi:hypothetical protein